MSIIKAHFSGRINSKVVLVISNNSASGALEAAKKYNIPAYHISQKLFTSESVLEEKILTLLDKFKIDLVVLAGYMKMLSSNVIAKYRNRIINIHPALLPAFGGKGMYGIHVHEAVLKAGEKVTGATVHLVNEVYDSGEIILQKKVEVRPGDTPGLLQKRVLETEHELYPEAIKLFEEKKILISDGKVRIV
jgi:phosphoribosylglycinamide formyltransferase-1